MNIKYFLNEYRRPLIVLTHFFLIMAAYLFSYYLRFEFMIPAEYLSVIFRTLPFLILIKMGIFYYFNLYSGLWRYASTQDLWRILKASSISTVAFISGIILIHGPVGFPRSIFVLDWLLCTGFLGGVRLLSRLLRERLSTGNTKKSKKVLIVGAGGAGIMLLREYRNNPSMNANVVGFIDDDPAKLGLHIHGIKVLGNREAISDLCNKLEADEIVIAIPSAKGETLRQILPYCQIPGIKVKIVPSLHKIINGDLEVKPRYIRPEDLLGRDTVKIDERQINLYIRNKRVLVTGAGGSIGSELCRQIIRFDPEEIVLFDHNENDVYFLVVEFKTKYPKIRFKTIIGDIRDVGLLKHVFAKYRPHVVFHSAAHKHVPLMEENPAAGVKNNIMGSRNLIYASHHYKVERFILISTDKAVKPTSIMGATKRIAEMILQAKSKLSQTKFMAVRFGNVIGSDGSVVPLFKKQIEEGGPLTVTHPDATRYFMSVHEAAQLVLQAGAIGKGGEIFVLDMGEPIKIMDLARNLIVLSGLEPDKDIPIEFIGLRQGEKLTEETLLEIENEKSAKYDKIFIAQPNDFDIRKIRRQIKELEHLAEKMDEHQIICKLKEIVASYAP